MGDSEYSLVPLLSDEIEPDDEGNSLNMLVSCYSSSLCPADRLTGGHTNRRTDGPSCVTKNVELLGIQYRLYNVLNSLVV